jgi:hypothetical protein
MSPLVYVDLDYLWWGVSIGGRHYTANLIIRGEPDRRVEMIRKLSAKEAKAYAEEQGLLWLARQRETNKFETLKQLERHALRWCEANLGENWLLLKGEHWNPSFVVGAKGWIEKRVKLLNTVASIWDKTPDHWRNPDSDLVKQIYKLWGSTLKPEKS